MFEGHVHPILLDIAFDEGDERHRALLDLGARLRLESELAEKAEREGAHLRPLDVVIDIPEPVSFETNLPVLAEEPGSHAQGRGGKAGCIAFGDCGTAFRPELVADFARTLRRVRVFVAEPSEQARKVALELLA